MGIFSDILYDDSTPASEAFTGYVYGNDLDQDHLEKSFKDHESKKFKEAYEGEINFTDILRGKTLETSLMSSVITEGEDDIVYPKEFDPRTIHKIEDQMRQGSCQGNSLTSGMEMIEYIIAGTFPIPDLSRNAAYRFSQEEDGITGDKGSTLSGGAAAARKGICLEKYYPYTETYSRRIPQSARTNRTYRQLMKAYSIPKSSSTKPHEVAYKHLSMGRGAIQFGGKWTPEMDNQNEITSYTGRGSGGGHAVSILGFFIDDRGDLWFWLANSWGTRFWGNKGWKPVHYKAFNSMATFGWNQFWLHSDLKDVRKIRRLPEYNFADIVNNQSSSLAL